MMEIAMTKPTETPPAPSSSAQKSEAVDAAASQTVASPTVDGDAGRVMPDIAAPERKAPVNREHLGVRLREAWHKTVGTWATDEKGTTSLVRRLVEFRTLSAEEAKRVLADAKKRVDENRAEVDRRVDESLHKASTFFSSEQKEVRRLEERITKLEARLQVLRAG